MVTTRRFKILAITGCCLGLLLAGCGRKAALEVPGASTPSTTAAEVRSAQGAGVPATGTSEPAVPERNNGFFLDPLIGR